MKQVMLDIGTLENDYNLVITSISAVAFDISDEGYGDEFETHIDIMGISLNKSISNSDTLNRELNPLKSVKTSLILFNKWLIKTFTNNLKDVELWSKTSFFILLLRNLYKQNNIQFLVPEWCDNDVYTLINISGIDVNRYSPRYTSISPSGIFNCKSLIDCSKEAYKGLK